MCFHPTSDSLQLFKDRFEITSRILGLGGYGSVFAAIHKKSRRQLACKVVNVEIYVPTKSKKKTLKDVTKSPPQNLIGRNEKRKLQKRRSPESRQLKIRDDPQFREFEILKDLDHPNIIRLEKVFWSVNTFYIFQELVTGGDLFSFIESKSGLLSDIEAAVILRQILKAIEYIHDRDIVHRDLKPDNILVTSTAEGARIIVTDFGNARYLPENDAELHDLPAMKRRMFTVAGTLEYVAPSVFPDSLVWPSFFLIDLLQRGTFKKSARLQRRGLYQSRGHVVDRLYYRCFTYWRCHFC